MEHLFYAEGMGARPAFDPCQLGLWDPAPPAPGAPVRLDLPGGDVTYAAAWLPAAEAGALFDLLLEATPWRQARRLMYDRYVDVPRLQAGFFEPTRARREPGWTEARTMPPALAAVHARLERELGVRFGWVLANLYRDGRDSVAMHADDETDLGPRPVIASLSLGAARRFLFRPKPLQPGVPLALALPAGSLLVMGVTTQLNLV
jgi:alkylated DNA repair dioxygenase AlkB